MISLRVNEIFNYLSTDRKKQDRSRIYNAVIKSEHKEKELSLSSCGEESGGSSQSRCDVVNDSSFSSEDSTADDILNVSLQNDSREEHENVLDGSCNEASRGKTQLPTLVGHYNLTDTSDSTPSSASSTNGDGVTVAAVKDVSSKRQRRRQTSSKPPFASSAANSALLTSENAPGITTQLPVKTGHKLSLCNSQKVAAVQKIGSQTPGSDCANAAVISRSNGRKKRSRRNQDRAASATVLDFRSKTSGGDMAATQGSKQTSLLSFEIGSCCSPEEKILPSAKCSCLEGVEGKGHQECELSVTTMVVVKTDQCSNSGGDDINGSCCKRDAVSLTTLPKRQPFSGIADLDSFDVDLSQLLPNVVASSSILDTHKIDALDNFDEILPSSPAMVHSHSRQSNSNDEEWTAVNRRCKKIMLAPEVASAVCGLNGANLETVSTISGAHVEVDRHGDRITVVIRGTADQIQSANNLVVALMTNAEQQQKSRKKNKKNRGSGGGGGGSRPRLKNAMAAGVNSPANKLTGVVSRQMRIAAEVNDSAAVSGLSVVSTAKCKSDTVAAVVDRDLSCSKDVQPNCVTNSSSSYSTTTTSAACILLPPSSMKEYSLFDSHFGRTVEQVMQRRDSPVFVDSGSCHAAGGASIETVLAAPQPPLQEQRQTSHLSAFPRAAESSNLALLAKAPGYRVANTESPSFGTSPHENNVLRKFSDSAYLSSLVAAAASSGGKSLEESLWGSTTNCARPVRRPMDAFCSSSSDKISVGIDRPHSLPQPAFSQFSPLAPGLERCGYRCFPGNDHRLLPQQQQREFPSGSGCIVPDRESGVALHTEKSYSSPYEPMTLPRISTDLNPNAPDFVYQPPGVTAPPSLHCSKPPFDTASMTNGTYDIFSSSGPFHSWIAEVGAVRSRCMSSSDLGLGASDITNNINDFPSSTGVPTFDSLLLPSAAVATAPVAMTSPSGGLRHQWPLSMVSFQESVMFS